MANFYHLMGVKEDDFHLSRRFLTSWLLPPMFLAIFRALIALYAFTTIFFILAWQGTHGLVDENNGELSYFTSLTFWGIAFYFLFSSIHTLLYARRGYAPLDHWPRPLQALHSLLYTTVVTFPFLVTIVFWVILYDGPWFPLEFDAWSNVSLCIYTCSKRSLILPSDLSPRPELTLRALRTAIASHKSSTLAASFVPHHHSCAVLSACLPHICDPRFLFIRFPESGKRARTGRCLLLRYTGRCHCRFPRCLATHLDTEETYSPWKEKSSRSVRRKSW